VAPAGAVAIAVLFSWLIGWFGVMAPVGRAVGLNRNALALATAFFVGAFFILADLNSYSPFPRNPYKLGLFVLISGFIAAGAHFGYVTLMNNSGTARHRAAILALPIVLAETTVFQWFHHFRVGSFVSVRAAALALAYLATAAVTVFLVYRLRQTRVVQGVLAVILVIIAVGALAVLGDRTGESKRSAGAFTGKIKHVVLIIVDTLRADCLTCYNPDAPHTPNIDRLATESVIFRSPISPAPWTLPAVASIMTGLPATVHGATAENSRLPDGLQMLAEYMQSAGYRTDAIGRNPILAAPRNLDQGFDSFRFFPRRGADGSVGTCLLKQLAPERYRSDASTVDLTDLAVDYTNGNSDCEFFFYLHYEDPHGPYNPPAEFRPAGEAPARIGYRFAQNKQIRAGTLKPTAEERAWIKALYDGEVRHVDQSIGRLLEGMRASGIYDNALIILTSDHGEEFFEHGNVAHGHTLYNELLHVPLIVKLPKSAAKGEYFPFVSVQRITPTILDMCGIEFDPNHMAGSSLSEFWTGEGHESDDTPYSTGVLYYEDRESVVFDGMKYIRQIDGASDELFNLNADPGEHKSLSSTRPVDVHGAQRLLEDSRTAAERMREIYELLGNESIELDEETIKRLKALGYM